MLRRLFRIEEFARSIGLLTSVSKSLNPSSSSLLSMGIQPARAGLSLRIADVTL